MDAHAQITTTVILNIA